MKLSLGDLNPGSCLPHHTSTYICGVTTAPRCAMVMETWYKNLNSWTEFTPNSKYPRVVLENSFTIKGPQIWDSEQNSYYHIVIFLSFFLIFLNFFIIYIFMDKVFFQMPRTLSNEDIFSHCNYWIIKGKKKKHQNSLEESSQIHYIERFIWSFT